MSSLLNNCADCASFILDPCEDILIAGLTPDTAYWWFITDQFGNVWKQQATTDVNGVLTIYEYFLPTGFLTSGIGTITIEIKLTEDALETVPLTFANVPYDCLEVSFSSTQPLETPIEGCMNVLADNYNPLAQVDDGSCSLMASEAIVFGCVDPTAENYNPDANSEDGTCTYASAVLGCTDPGANNYDPAATEDNGSCTYDAAPSENYEDIVCATFTVTSDVQYAPAVDASLVMDIYEETCNANTDRPVFICLHGGGGTKLNLPVIRYCEDMAGRGYKAFAIEYGVTGGGGGFTLARQIQAVINLSCCIRHIRANAVTYGINPDNIFTFGISAGALTVLQQNMCSNNLTDPMFSDPLSALYPTFSSVPTASGTQSGAASNTFMAFLDSVDHPNMFYHGETDTKVKYSNAVKTFNNMNAAGIVGSIFVSYPGLGHGLGVEHDDIVENPTTGIVTKFKNLISP